MNSAKSDYAMAKRAADSPAPSAVIPPTYRIIIAYCQTACKSGRALNALPLIWVNQSLGQVTTVSLLCKLQVEATALIDSPDMLVAAFGKVGHDSAHKTGHGHGLQIGDAGTL